jgi:hypothetical protein
MGTANLTAIKERITELSVVPKPKNRTAVARSQRGRQRRKQNHNMSAGAATPAITARRNRYSSANIAALLAALGLAAVSGFFSIVGLTSIFLGSFWPVVAMGTVLEGGKLSAVALLGQRRVASRALRFAIVTLIAALMALNVVGAYGFLARAQITHTVAGEVLVADHAARVGAQKKIAAAKVADIDKRIGQIDSAVAEATKRGRTTAAMMLAVHSADRRDALVAERTRAAGDLASIDVESAGVDNERAGRAADFGPVEYLSKLIGANRDVAMRWFIVLIAGLLDPAALMLLLAASEPDQKIIESPIVSVA